MQPHDIDTWMKIIGKLPHPAGYTTEQVIANRIVGDLVGYNHHSKFRAHDVIELANAITAYARMMNEAGVKP